MPAFTADPHRKKICQDKLWQRSQEDNHDGVRSAFDPYCGLWNHFL